MSRLVTQGVRFDPLRGFKFQVQIPGNGRFASAGFTTVDGLNTGETEVVEYREGIMDGTVRKLPGLTTFGDVTLTRGVSSNNVDLQKWRNEVYEVRKGTGIPAKDFRRDLIVDLFDRQIDINNPTKSWKIHSAWAMSLALGTLDAQSSDVLIETLVVANEGISALRVEGGLASSPIAPG